MAPTSGRSSPKREPLEAIEWRAAAELNANDYNPNVVFTPELRLLERSILLTGWVQPVLITDDGTIIDGFHRVTLSQRSKPLMARYGGLVPCAVLDLTRPEAMALTVRINRAKGSHVAVRMAELVKELVHEHGQSQEWVAEQIGATKDEVELLLQESVFKARNLAGAPYSKAWIPKGGAAP